jgi:hypothetical protein
VAPTAPGGLAAAQLIADAQAAYAAGQRALANGDFATYGEKQKQVSNDLDQLAKLLGTPSPSSSGAASPPASPSRSP